MDWIAHDVIEGLIGTDAAFGVTLGDIVFDDLNVFEPLNRTIALLGIPWYNVLGNHDINTDAHHRRHANETFESLYGPSYYSFDYGPVHFLVLDNIEWTVNSETGKKGWRGGIGPSQLEFIQSDLSQIPAEQMVVLLMHVPFTSVHDRHGLYRLIEQRPFCISISGHTHTHEHIWISKADGWEGPQPHHHIINVTVCGSWWSGAPDERGIPHTTMADGGPNGYSVLSFDGTDYRLDYHAAGRPENYQLEIDAPEVVAGADLARTAVFVNVFNGSEKTQVRMRVGDDDWQPLQKTFEPDPKYVRSYEAEAAILEQTQVFRKLPKPRRRPICGKAHCRATSHPGRTGSTLKRRTTGDGRSPVIGSFGSSETGCRPVGAARTPLARVSLMSRLPRVLITDHPWPDLAIESSVLRPLDVEIVDAPDGSESTLVELAHDVDAIATCWAQVSEPVLEAAANCRHVARMGIGLDNIDVEAASRRGMLVTNVPDYCIDEVANHAIGMLLGHARNLAFFHLRTKRGEYDLAAAPRMRRLTTQTLGLLGLGRIGRRTAEKGRGLGLNVIAHTPSGDDHGTGVRMVDWETLLTESDYLCLHAPLSDATRKIIDRDALAKMKPTAVLINTSRGGLVDEAALVEALESDRLAGAGLDVFDPEPPDLMQQLFRDERVIVTPHAAFVSEEAVVELRTRVAGQIKTVLEGGTPENVLKR